ncbi:putative malate dehydrogenase [Lentinula detonsa]|uniref:Malate dehydrogenase n=1 Tax=Lentinula detonsa TaxID=2804962 RepID=A0AA38PV61_9AGAR|nr:putative malate dehydrogenase [Lentinula detonsa]
MQLHSYLAGAAPTQAHQPPRPSPPSGGGSQPPIDVTNGTACNVSTASIDTSGTTLPAPSFATSFIGLGVGMQNYTCGSAGTYLSTGALADLFDVSCLVGQSSFNTLQTTAFAVWNSSTSTSVSSTSDVLSSAGVLSSPIILGQHYFITNPVTGSGLSPKWDFTSNALAGNADAFVVATKVDDVAAPTGSADVDWLYLTNLTGTLANEVYRIDTQGGQPPASCMAGSADITVKYTSMYWLTGGSF